MRLCKAIKREYTTAKLITKEFGISFTNIFVHYLFKKNNRININLRDHSISLDIRQIAALVTLSNNGWQVKSIDNTYVKMLSPDGSVINCRLQKGADFLPLVEIWINKDYGKNFRDKNVIDVGAYNGDSSIFFAKEGAKRVIAFEPDKSSYLLALENIAESGVADIVSLINKAISNKTGKTELVVYDHYPNANSIDETNMVDIDDTKHKEYIECISLKEAIDMFGGESTVYLKMDCEGCEYAALNSLDEDDYNRIENIYVEYHNGIQNLVKMLKEMGFSYHITGNPNKVGYIVASKDKSR